MSPTLSLDDGAARGAEVGEEAEHPEHQQQHEGERRTRSNWFCVTDDAKAPIAA